MAGEIQIIIDELKKMNTTMDHLKDDFAEFKTEVRTSLTETNGKMKGNFELLDKSLTHLEKQNELQHESIRVQMHLVNGIVEGLKKQINHLYDLDRERAKREEEIESMVIDKVDQKITAVAIRLELEIQKSENRTADVLGQNKAEINRISNSYDVGVCELREQVLNLAEAATVAKTTRNIAIGILVVLIPYLLTGTIAGIKMWAVLMGG